MSMAGRRLCVCGSLVVATWLAGGGLALAQTTPATAPPADSAASPPAAPPSPVLAHLFQDTISDFRHVPSRDTLLWLTVGTALSGVSRTLDHPVSNHLPESPALDSAFAAGGIVGDARLQFGGALATYVAGRIIGSHTIAATGGDLLRAQIVSLALTGAVKITFRRTRPDGSTRSFPSGHTSITFASATVLQRDFGWKFGVPAYAVASYVAMSRVERKRHYLSDVTFGATLGFMAGRTVTVRRGKHRVVVAPMAVPGGGGGISFTLGA